MRTSEGGEFLGFTYFYKVYDSFEGGLQIQAIFNDITGKYVPPCVNILYCLGEITLVFLVQDKITSNFYLDVRHVSFRNQITTTIIEAFASI